MKEKANEGDKFKRRRGAVTEGDMRGGWGRKRYEIVRQKLV